VRVVDVATEDTLDGPAEVSRIGVPLLVTELRDTIRSMCDLSALVDVVVQKLV
jgi:hypothetical protein